MLKQYGNFSDKGVRSLKLIKGVWMRFFLMVFALSLYTFSSSLVHADTFRCPNGTIVSTGDSISEVVLKCDKPTFVYTRQQPEQNSFGRIAYIEIQEWTYDLGRQYFVYFLTFRNGILTEVRSGGYGK